MASAHNTTTVHYGTTWNDSTLLEEVKQTNLELERKDGIKRHFRYDWQEVARYNPAYLAFVENERQRLGEEHPLFRTQYALLPVKGGGGLLTAQQIAQLNGTHNRLRRPRSGSAVYIAGIDFAGEIEVTEDRVMTTPGRDATVITIAELVDNVHRGSHREREIKVVEHYSWIGEKHAELHTRMLNILKNVWNCRYIICDATGIGEPITSFLKHELGSRVIPYKFTQKTKSDAGFDLLAAINSGRLKIYRQDGSAEYAELLHELERARSNYRPNQTLNFYVEPGEGHDDFLISLALVVQAGKNYIPARAKGTVREV